LKPFTWEGNVVQLPNYTQVSNDFIDRIMRECKGSEVKVALVIFRKTIGWHKRTEAVPFSQIRELTGLKNNRDIHTALEALEEKGVIVVNRGGRKENGFWETWTYDLNIDSESQQQPDDKMSPGDKMSSEPGDKMTPESTPPPGDKMSPSKESTTSKESSKERGLLAEVKRLQELKPANQFLANARYELETTGALSQARTATLATMSKENPAPKVEEPPVEWKPSSEMRARMEYQKSAEAARNRELLQRCEEAAGVSGVMELTTWCRKHGIDLDLEDLAATLGHIKEAAEPELVEVF
jgi:phage replication O-like protein O